MNETLEHALRAAGLPDAIASTRDLSGGCIHRVVAVQVADGRSFVCKVNRSDARDLFEEEAAGLRALARTGAVVVPEPLAVTEHGGRAVLLMKEVPHGRAGDRGWRRLGEDLAALHAADAGGRYGFEIDNHLGSTFQPNTWCDDWVEFNAVHRLGHQVKLARDSGKLTADECAVLGRVIAGLERLLPRKPKPSLLHGDLWSGNALPTVGDRVAVIDPAPSVGDGWADIAMMRLFGGFSPACFEAYAGLVEDHDGVDERLAVYQLYHVLNHVNIFGRGYAGQALALAERLG